MLPELAQPPKTEAAHDAAAASEVADWLKDCLRLIAKCESQDRFDRLDVRRYARAFAGVPREIAERVAWEISDTCKWRPTVPEIRERLESAMKAALPEPERRLMLPPPEAPYSGISEETREEVRERLRGLFGKVSVPEERAPINAEHVPMDRETEARMQAKRRMIREQLAADLVAEEAKATIELEEVTA